MESAAIIDNPAPEREASVKSLGIFLHLINGFRLRKMHRFLMNFAQLYIFFSHFKNFSYETMPHIEVMNTIPIQKT